MAHTTAANYRNSFEYPELTKIFGRPSYDSLKLIEDELKANAQAVFSPLGGGQHGHLGLVVSPFQYASVSNIPFITPPTPRPFVIIPQEAPHVAQQRLAQHNTSKELFQEVHGVKRALVQQLIQAVDKTYLKDMRHPLTNTLDHLQIYEILNNLFQRYGQISASQLTVLEEQVKNMAWDPSQPIDNIFTAIDRLSDAAYRAGSEYSAAQKNNMAQVILTRTGAFRTGLRNWLHLPIPMRTWEAFKTHFRTEQGLLEAVHEETLQDSRLQQANLVQQVVDGVQNMLISTEPEPAPAPAQRENPVTPMVHTMNAVHNNELIPNLMAQIL